MGSYIELNDTLQITREQGFPAALDLKTHKSNPYSASDFKDIVFEFKDKTNIRIYHLPPVRVFLVENINGKWLYWGLVHIFEVQHDYEKKTTSGKFKIIHIYSYEDMEKAHELIDRNPDTSYFG